MTNRDFAAVFGEVADLLEFQDANPFRVRAYRNAARKLGDMSGTTKRTGVNSKVLDRLSPQAASKRVSSPPHNLWQARPKIVVESTCRMR
jgi:hypothetical protein